MIEINQYSHIFIKIHVLTVALTFERNELISIAPFQPRTNISVNTSGKNQIRLDRSKSISASINTDVRCVHGLIRKSPIGLNHRNTINHATISIVFHLNLCTILWQYFKHFICKVVVRKKTEINPWKFDVSQSCNQNLND